MFADNSQNWERTGIEDLVERMSDEIVVIEIRTMMKKKGVKM